VTKCANWRGPGTKYKHSKIDFAASVTSITLSLGHLGTRLLVILALSLIGSLPCHVGVLGALVYFLPFEAI